MKKNQNNDCFLLRTQINLLVEQNYAHNNDSLSDSFDNISTILPSTTCSDEKLASKFILMTYLSFCSLTEKFVENEDDKIFFAEKMAKLSSECLEELEDVNGDGLN